jgi:hydroxymethylpyrimidine pyrophosphatase-like HAD family hydrolase
VNRAVVDADGPARLRPRLIVTDLDGTFLLPDGSVSPTNAAAVKAAHRAGIPVVFATGRPLRWLDVIADLPGAHPLVIASNGAILYDQGTDTVLDRQCLDPATTAWAIDTIRTAVPDAAFGLESGTSFGHDERYLVLIRPGEVDPRVYCGDIATIARRTDHVKLLVQHAELDSDALLTAVRTALESALKVDPRHRGLMPTHSGVARRGTREAGLVEISAPGVSKASMLERCCERLGVAARDVAAFGDMPNDVDMLSWAGIPRVVANAHPRLLASYPTVPANTDSGVGRTILDWLA